MIRNETTDAQTGDHTIETWDITGGYTRTVNGVGAEQRPLTPDETAMVNAQTAAQTAQANGVTVSTRLATVDIPAMAAIIAQTNADLRADPAQEIKDIARAVRRLCRKVEGILDGTD